MHIFVLAAIPLVDPEYNLLPIHFAVDPGTEWNGVDCLDGEQSTALLRRFLDVQEVSIPRTSSVTPSSNSSVEVPSEGPVLPKAGSWSELGQTLSAESSLTEFNAPTISRSGNKNSGRRLNNGVPEETHVKTSSLSRNKFPLQMHNVARSFGSLGRSFRKLKKNFVMIARRGTLKRADKTDGTSVITPADSSIAAVQNNSKAHRDYVLCARLLHRRQPYQEEMVRNYLSNAAEKFQQECNKQAAVCTSTTVTPDFAGYENTVITTKCVNADCSGMGDVATAYLCAGCYERQKRDEIDAASNGAVTSESVVPSSLLQTSIARSSSGCKLVSTTSNGGVLSTMPCGSSVVVYDNLHGNAVGRSSPLPPSVSATRRQFTDSLERQLDELQKAVDKMPSSTYNKSVAFRIE